MRYIARRLSCLSSHLRLHTSSHPIQFGRSIWAGIASSLKSLVSKPPEQIRKFPTSGFHTIESDQLFEEEQIPGYVAERFYPVHIGDVFQDRYQVVAKLGFGSSSTIWLARDLKDREYVALKVQVHTSKYHREIPCYDHLSRHLTTNTTHRGRNNIRHLLGSFEIVGPGGKHPVLVFQASQMSLRDMKLVFFPKGYDEAFVKGAIIELLEAISFLHNYGEVVHTDIHSGNLLLGIQDSNQLQGLEDTEFKSPVERKPVSNTRTIYLSRILKPKVGPMLLSDFGEARIGPGPHEGDIMPTELRAPEVLLSTKWSYPVDIWSVGLTAWDLLGLKRIFTARSEEDGRRYDAVHFAEMIAALGPPPAEYLAKNPERSAQFWDSNGKWLGVAKIPEGRTLESLEDRLDDNTQLLRFLRRILTWMPEQRATARELLSDPWLAKKRT